MPASEPTYRFDFYERVRIVGGKPGLAPVHGEIAVVLGRSGGSKEPGYAVSVYTTGECWAVTESDLEATGEFDRRETFFPGDSVRVSVDSDGRGTIL
ncbi:MAG: hypothetical protein AAGK21_16885 [Bacteroidota bacterium]